MRDYALNHAMSHGEHGHRFPAAPAAAELEGRRAGSRLDNFDDYMLRDIGVSRDEVRWAAGLPLTVNAALALEERSQLRKNGRLKD